MSITDAIYDIRYLLDRGYPQKSAVGFVCDRYRLDAKTRHVLSRAVIPRKVCEERKRKFLPCSVIEENSVIIDGYNIIIGMESILEKKALMCDDGVVRDIKGVSRNFRISKRTKEAICLIMSFLEGKSPSRINFLLDAQISKSGMLAKLLRENIRGAGLTGDANTSRHVDHDLKCSESIVVSSDGVIIDAAEKVVNFLSCMISESTYLEAGINKLDEFAG